MHYDGSPEKRKQLQTAMQELHTKFGIKDGEVYNAIKKWLREEPEFSLKTYTRYRCEGGMKTYSYAYTIYDFLSRGDERYRMLSSHRGGARTSTDDERFLDAFLKRFGPLNRSFDQDVLEGFRFTYELFRRSWKIDDGKHFVRTLLKVEKENGVYKLSETVNFNLGGNNVTQTDSGIIFAYEPNFCALCNSSQGLKFFSFHDRYPHSHGQDAVDELKGNLVAVTGSREHPSFRIFARRIKSGHVEMNHYHVNDFRNDPSMKEVLKYILPKIEENDKNWYHD